MLRPRQMTFTSFAEGTTQSVKRALIANIKTARKEVNTLPTTMWKVGIDNVVDDNDIYDWTGA